MHCQHEINICLAGHDIKLGVWNARAVFALYSQAIREEYKE